VRVLTVVPHYLPGYKAGGPVRTIINLVDWLGAEFEFLILTADRDFGERQPYANVCVDTWQAVDKAQVCYLPPKALQLWRWPARLNKFPYDVLYLNSYFTSTTRHLLWLRYARLLPDTPVIVAPRGEFSPGALALKPKKKRMYLSVARLLRLSDSVVWQASSELEKMDIMRAVTARSIQVAPNLPTRNMPTVVSQRAQKNISHLKVVFFARISRKKNLDYALRLFHSAEGTIEFDIYGPLEDMMYWQECQAIISGLPSNVRVEYKGSVEPERVNEVLARYHLLLLPTRGENFGHAILEALQAGCPVLISDQTPWRELSAAQAGWDLPLEQPEQFTAVIDRTVAMDAAEFTRWSDGARRFGERFAADPAVLEANRQLFSTSVR
jgi:glycosyltransferase involved in cell wall biosynthesis